MTGKLNSLDAPQPEHFAFSARNEDEVTRILARYPEGKQQSAVMPLLMLAQRQNGNWLTKAAMDHIAERLGMPPVRVYEVASFYTMYNLEPVGQHVIEVCTTTPCWLRGSDSIVKACEDFLGVKMGETTADGKFTLREAECLGACVNAPMCQVGENYYEDLTPDSMRKVLDFLNRNLKPNPGPQSGRKASEPMGGCNHGTQSNSHDPHFGIKGETARETMRAEAPGDHPAPHKDYSGEPGNKKKGE